MPKRIILILSVIMVMSLFISACGNKNVSSSETPTEKSAEEEASPSESTAESAESNEASPSITPSVSPSASPSESASASSSSDLQKFDGYLVDATCGKRGKDEKGNDLTKYPMKHTVACLKNHAKSGYGLFRGQGNGTFKFFLLDEDGNKQVKRYIIDKTTKKDDLRIAVRGTLDEDGTTIHVKVVMAYGLE